MRTLIVVMLLCIFWYKFFKNERIIKEDKIALFKSEILVVLMLSIILVIGMVNELGINNFNVLNVVLIFMSFFTFISLGTMLECIIKLVWECCYEFICSITIRE